MHPQMIVWYHIELDEIFVNIELDYLFYALQECDWGKVICLGEL